MINGNTAAVVAQKTPQTFSGDTKVQHTCSPDPIRGSLQTAGKNPCMCARVHVRHVCPYMYRYTYLWILCDDLNENDPHKPIGNGTIRRS